MTRRTRRNRHNGRIIVNRHNGRIIVNGTIPVDDSALRTLLGTVSVLIIIIAVVYKLLLQTDIMHVDDDSMEFQEIHINENKVDKQPSNDVPRNHQKLDEVSFTNVGSSKVELWWSNPNGDDVLQATLEIGGTTYQNTWMGHTFYFTPIGSGESTEPDNVMYTVTMQSSAPIVLYDDMIMTEKRSMFNREYERRTGRRWENWWPREPITHHYHQVNQIGEVIKATTDRSQFEQCSEGALSEEDIATLKDMEAQSKGTDPPMYQIENDLYYIGRINGTTYCRQKVDPEGLTWDITNICNEGPNAFRIFDFLSDDEMEHIKELGQTIGMFRSLAGDVLTESRTSQQVWLSRDFSFIVDNIIRRIGDMLKISEEKLFLNASAEHLQLVHYFSGELYKAHVDYTTNKPHIRYITFLMYLNEVSEGGNTSFPKAHDNCKDENGYFGVQPIKGSVVFFYDLLPDGNVDEMTQHYAEPPVDSEKWMTNLWIWDKVYTG